jgi:uncharacterized protein YggE
VSHGGSDRVEVIGTGTAQVRPDLFVAQLGAEATGPDVATVLEAAELAVAAMAGAARAGGAADADVRTTDVTVSTNYTQTGPEGYRAAIGLGLTLHDLESAGRVLAEVVAAGGDASRVNAVSMTVADPHPALDAAREAAFADARHQAEQLAALAGRTLGGVRRITPQQVFHTFARTAAFQQQSKPLSAMPIEAGAATLTVSLKVRFDLD